MADPVTWMLIGAGVGAGTAAATGGDIGKGAMFGAAGGGLGGFAGGAAAGGAGGLTASQGAILGAVAGGGVAGAASGMGKLPPPTDVSRPPTRVSPGEKVPSRFAQRKKRRSLAAQMDLSEPLIREEKLGT